MFSINIYLKFALIGLFLGGGILLAIFYGFWYALPFILIGLGLLASYILLGTVQSAAQMVQLQQFDEAEERLKLTYQPDWLYKTNRAFYYMIMGTIAMQKKDNKTAEQHLNKAKNIELPSDNEKAMVLLQLANIHATRNNWNKAKVFVSDLKKLKVTEPMIKEQVKQFDMAISQRGQMKHAQGMQMSGQRNGFRQKQRRKRK